MLNGIDVVYWINLDRSNDRRDNMNAMFRDDAFKNIRNERFSAIDYKTNDVMKQFILDESEYKNNQPEYACFLSHLETIRQFANCDLPDDAVALIMEDDANLEYKPYWKIPIENVIENAPSDWEIIMLNYMFLDGTELPDLTGFSDYEKNTGQFFSALAYLMRKSTAKRMMNKMYHSGKYDLDPSAKSHHADEYLFTTLNTYAYKYPFFTYKTENESYLHPNDLDNHKRCKLHIAKTLYGIDPSNEGFSTIDGSFDFGDKSILLYLIFALCFVLIGWVILNRNSTLKYLKRAVNFIIHKIKTT
jgi:GR25 family glycosyltransferase involved in LPS biosynthesis